ncbi:MAG: outer membrane beta-barrel protein [Mariprofundaceae bacterium]|nr:outer membrane beta-barrel protein [Mariprofundaceae bacterium]
MKTSFRLLAVAAILFVCITPARAGDHYAGLGIGAFQMDGGTGSKTSAGAYIQLGHEFMDYLSAEVRIGTASSATKNNEKMQLDWLVAHFIRPYYDISGDFSVYGLAGFTVNHSTLQIGAGSKLKKTNVSLSFGAGVQADIGNNLAVGAEWVSYAREADASRRTTSFQGLNVSSLTATLKYAF